MKCHLVLDAQSKGWVIEKMCRRLGDELTQLGCAVSIGEEPDPSCDINHYMLFWWVSDKVPPRSTIAVTHIDDSHRMDLAKTAAAKADLLICMSTMTVKQLLNEGVPREKLCYVLPALDEGIKPRRIVIGLTTKLYPDGRKRESLLLRLAQEMDLSDFQFDIYGSGWEEVARTLRNAGAAVELGPEDLPYDAIREKVRHFDYYLYMGLDEGSLGTLDALAAGVKTIVTPQGFHVDLPHGITHPFWHYEELHKVFEEIRDERNSRVHGVAPLTWKRYAEKHLSIWDLMAAGRQAEVTPMLGQESLEPLGGYSENMEEHMADERKRLYARSVQRYKIPRLKSAVAAKLRQWFPRFSRHLFRNG